MLSKEHISKMLVEESPDVERPQSDTRQVIVLRTHFPDGNGGKRKVRLGKYISQACHASNAFLTYYVSHPERRPTAEEQEWIDSSFTKICLGVETEEELEAVAAAGESAGLKVNRITDNGKTEFGGEKTFTCIAIGPHRKERIDRITKHLKLL